MALEGHTNTHFLHFLQASSMMRALPFVITMALAGQTFKHSPQPVHKVILTKGTFLTGFLSGIDSYPVISSFLRRSSRTSQVGQ